MIYAGLVLEIEKRLISCLVTPGLAVSSPIPNLDRLRYAACQFFQVRRG
jgi:hypothetical protein